jgi:hypothetical protein
MQNLLFYDILLILTGIIVYVTVEPQLRDPLDIVRNVLCAIVHVASSILTAVSCLFRSLCCGCFALCCKCCKCSSSRANESIEIDPDDGSQVILLDRSTCVGRFKLFIQKQLAFPTPPLIRAKTGLLCIIIMALAIIHALHTEFNLTVVETHPTQLKSSGDEPEVDGLVETSRATSSTLLSVEDWNAMFSDVD